jgi:tRNA-modifying protein YgfZ
MQPSGNDGVKLMNSPLKTSALESLGVVRAQGADVVPFLQGQLSNDIAQLAPGRSLLAGYHSPQGRTIAVLRLVEHEPGDILMILPRELAATVAARLGKFVLRAKVKLSDESAAWSIHGLTWESAPPVGTALPLPAQAYAGARHASARIVRMAAAPARALVVQPHGTPAVFADAGVADEALWHAGSIAAAEPQVFAATSEEFVAQMLNLDLLGAIAFEKGCYTGQEVIARAHYRGRVKRRLQRFVTTAAAVLKPGDSGELPDGRGMKVVDAVQRADGRCEFLGVASFATDEADGAADVAAATTTAAARIDALPLPMPYALPR